MASKKSFKPELKNPAMSFISTPEEETPAEEKETKKREAAPSGFKKNPLYVETKTRRVQLLMQPGLHEKVKARAVREGKSFNDFVHALLEKAVEGK